MLNIITCTVTTVFSALTNEKIDSVGRKGRFFHHFYEYWKIKIKLKNEKVIMWDNSWIFHILHAALSKMVVITFL